MQTQPRTKDQEPGRGRWSSGSLLFIRGWPTVKKKTPKRIGNGEMISENPFTPSIPLGTTNSDF